MIQGLKMIKMGFVLHGVNKTICIGACISFRVCWCMRTWCGGLPLSFFCGHKSFFLYDRQKSPEGY